MLTVATVLDIVHVVASLFTQQTHSLGACDMKMELAALLIAIHASTNFRF